MRPAIVTGWGKMKVLFNSEGNKTIGMGAFYNCAVLAGKFREKFAPEIKFFISRDSEKGVKDTLLRGYDVEKVDMSDTESFISAIKKFKPDIVVQDLLVLDKSYMSQLNKLKATVVNITHSSDINSHEKADIVISLLHDFGGRKCVYGPGYAILDDRFKKIKRKKIKDIASNLLVSFGGSDVNNLTFKLMKILDKMDLYLHANVVIGPGFRDGDKADNILSGLKNKRRFTMNRNVADMTGLISGADLAFVSGGRTICELAAAGVSGIAFAQNELEHGRLKRFERWGSVLNYGYLRDDNGQLAAKIKNVILDKNSRERMSRKGRELIDGNGTDRIIERIMDLRKKKIS